MYKKLVFDEWWTEKQNQAAGENGIVYFGSCFLGTYEIKVLSGEKTITKSVEILLNENNEITLNVSNENVIVEGNNHADTPVFTSVETSIKSSSELKIYPNPTMDVLNFKVSGIQVGQAKIQVYDTSGSLVLQQELGGTVNGILDVTGLKPGLYFFSFGTSKNRQTKRFVVQ